MHCYKQVLCKPVPKCKDINISANKGCILTNIYQYNILIYLYINRRNNSITI